MTKRFTPRAGQFLNQVAEDLQDFGELTDSYN
jgi:hypothetical protein